MDAYTTHGFTLIPTWSVWLGSVGSSSSNSNSNGTTCNTEHTSPPPNVGSRVSSIFIFHRFGPVPVPGLPVYSTRTCLLVLLFHALYFWCALDFLVIVLFSFRFGMHSSHSGLCAQRRPCLGISMPFLVFNSFSCISGWPLDHYNVLGS